MLHTCFEHDDGVFVYDRHECPICAELDNKSEDIQSLNQSIEEKNLLIADIEQERDELLVRVDSLEKSLLKRIEK